MPVLTISPIVALTDSRRFRTPAVLAQIRRLQHMAPTSFWSAVGNTDHTHPDFVAPEALVYLLRTAIRQKEPRIAARLTEILVRQTAVLISRTVAREKFASADTAADCAQDILVSAVSGWNSLAEGHEFFEVNFITCMQREAGNILDRYRRQLKHEAPSVHSGMRGNEEYSFDIFEAQPARCDICPAEKMAADHLLSLLPEDERAAFILKNRNQCTHAEIAHKLAVSDRTVRHLLGRAQSILASNVRRMAARDLAVL